MSLSVKSVVPAIIFKGLGFISMLLLNVVIAKQFSSELLGDLSLFISTSLVVSILLRFGSDNIVVREIASLPRDIKAGCANRLMNKTVVISIAIFLFLLLLSYFIMSYMQIDTGASIYDVFLVLLNSLMLAVVFMFGFAFQGRGHIIKYIFINNSLPYYLFIAFVLLVNIDGSNLKEIFTLTSLFSLVIVLLAWMESFSPLFGCNKEYKYGELISKSKGLLLISLKPTLEIWMILQFVGLYSTSSSVGVFSLIEKLSILVTYSLIAINSIIAPRFAELLANENYDEAFNQLLKSSFLSAALALPVILVIALFGENILRLIGDEFVAGYLALCVLLVGQTVNALTGSVGVFLIMSHNQALYIRSAIYSLFVAFILSIVLIPEYGLMGAAVSLTMSTVVNNVMSLFYCMVYKRKLAF